MFALLTRCTPLRRKPGSKHSFYAPAAGDAMLKRTETRFSHVKPADTQFMSGEVRDFFL